MTMPLRTGRRRRALDPRLLVGLLLVLVSVVGVVAVVRASEASVAVVAARATLHPGERVRASDLMELRMRPESAGRYLRIDQLPADGIVVQRTIGRGELVPASAVGGPRSGELSPVVVPTSGALAEAVSAGAVVDVWGAAQSEGGGYGTPAVIVPAAEVVRVTDGDGILASSSSAVEVLVPADRVARLLQAIADEDALALVPTGLPLGSG